MALLVSYGIATVAVTAVIVLLMASGGAQGASRRMLILCGVTALWAGASAVQAWWHPGVAHILEDARGIVWLEFLASLLLTSRDGGASASNWRLRLLAPGFGLIVICNDARFLLSADSPVALDFTQLSSRLAIAVAGILLVENLLRNTDAVRRWHVVPLCIGFGGLFAYDLFLYSDALLFRQVNPAFLAARGFVVALIVPLFVLTAVRNRDWRIELHISRQIVLHTATLLASGVFLLIAAGMGFVLRRVPGDWGTLLQVTVLSGSLLVLVTVLSSGGVRSRVRNALSRHLFAQRYDYRVEWMKFVDTVSNFDDTDPLQVRVIRAVADVVDSPGGALWLRSGTQGYRPSSAWNMPFEPVAFEPEEGAFIAGFGGGETIQEFSTAKTNRQLIDPRPQWARSGRGCWLAVPLLHWEGLTGFIALAPPRAPFTLNWESLDLLRVVGKQVASYLSEERALRGLMESKSLTEYSQRFAFVVHDIKNLVSQLSMTVANAARYGENPEFRADMLYTLENSIGRMKRLLLQLHSEASEPPPQGSTDPADVIQSVVLEIGRGRALLTMDGEIAGARLSIEPEALRSALTHLVTNAVEASGPGKIVTVRAQGLPDQVLIDVRDEGPGMSDAFVREQLFKPFQSTKSDGYGIGAYQTRETIRAAGGELQVITAPGAGTTMRVSLPRASGAVPHHSSAAALNT